MKLLVTGGTGFVGRHLVREAKRRGHSVLASSRNASTAREALPDTEILAWDPNREPLPAPAGLDAVIHLPGESIAEGRWTKAKMMRIVDSRVNGTRNLVTGLKKNPPKTLVSASAIGWYGPHGDEELDEHSPHGADFLSSVGVEWEREARHAVDLGIQVCVVRIGIVLGRDGGALPRMLTPFKLFVGGPIGGGAQWMSWIHIDDLVGILLHAAEKGVHGTLNATAPEPATNREFSRTLGRVIGRPSFLPTPGFMLRIVLGKVTQILTTGQRVLPRQTLASGYAFKFPALEPALRNLLA